MEFTQETINQYGIFGALFGALATVMIYKGVPAFFNYLNKLGELRLKSEEIEHQTQQVENTKDLAQIKLTQVIADENTELRTLKHQQAAQILEQATEISRLKNYEIAVEEYRRQRALLLEWIVEQSGQYLHKDTLITQLRADVAILETMISTEYKDVNIMSDKPP